MATVKKATAPKQAGTPASTVKADTRSAPAKSAPADDARSGAKKATTPAGKVEVTEPESARQGAQAGVGATGKTPAQLPRTAAQGGRLSELMKDMADATGIQKADRKLAESARFQVVPADQVVAGAHGAEYDGVSKTVKVPKAIVEEARQALKVLRNNRSPKGPGKQAADPRVEAARRTVIKTYALLTHEAKHAQQDRTGVLDRARAAAVEALESARTGKGARAALAAARELEDDDAKERDETLGEVARDIQRAAGGTTGKAVRRAATILTSRVEYGAQRAQERFEAKYATPPKKGDEWLTLERNGKAKAIDAKSGNGKDAQTNGQEYAQERGAAVVEGLLGENTVQQTGTMLNVADQQSPAPKSVAMTRPWADRLPHTQRVSGMDQPGSASPGFRNPGSRNPGFRNPGEANPGFRNPGFRNPGFRNPGFRNPGFRNPGELS